MSDVLTAWHEAAHAVVCWAAGGEIVGPLSIVGRHHWSGVCFARGTDVVEDVEVDMLLPAVLWPPAARSPHETEMLILLAGHVGETLAPLRDRADDPAYDPARLSTRPTIALSAEDRELLAQGDDPDRTPIENDFARAWDEATILQPNDACAMAQIQLLELEVRALLEIPHVRDKVARLAGYLLEHRELSADTVRALVASRPIVHDPNGG